MLYCKAHMRGESTCKASNKLFGHRLLRQALTGLEAPATCVAQARLPQKGLPLRIMCSESMYVSERAARGVSVYSNML